MYKFNTLVLILVLVLSHGCSWIQQEETADIEIKSTEYIEESQVIDGNRIKRGGKLLIEPFKAGPGIEATDELEYIALKIVKGVSEIMVDEGGSFEILTMRNAKDADLEISGNITQIGKSGVLNKLILRDEERYLGIRGYMIDVKTGKRLAFFEEKIQSSSKEQDYKILGELIGRNIGRFLLGKQ